MTTADSLTLLRQLQGAARPPRTAAPGATAQGAAPELSFTDLLERARAGDLASNREITLAPGLDHRFDAQTLARLSLAADQAEAAGIRTALVITDRQSFLLDVAQRTLTSAADLSKPLAGIDGVINLAGALTPAPAAPAVLPISASSAALAADPSVRALLQTLERPAVTTDGAA